MSDERLIHELHIQSQQIDAVLDHYELDAQVSSGAVHVSEDGKRSTFNLFGKLASGLEQARALKRDLQKALQVSQLNLDEEQGRIQLNLFGQRAPVELLKVLDAVDDVPPLTAVLGWSYDQRPVLLDFKAEETSHVLIAGNGRAGKTSLLRTIILSLALRNRERDLQLAVINARYNQTPQPYSHSGLRPFNYLPHLITPVIDNYDTAIETLQFLVEEIQYRTQNRIRTPHIVVLIDHLVDLIEVCGPAALLPLTHIIRNGAKSGVHLVLSTQRVEVAILQDIHDAYIPARFVGQVESARQAEIAADAYDTQAENLRGEGDFLAVVGQSLNHFQVAYVDDYDLHLCLEKLHRSRPKSLLAHRFDPRPQLSMVDETAVYQPIPPLKETAEGTLTTPAVDDPAVPEPIFYTPPPVAEMTVDELMFAEVASDHIDISRKEVADEPTNAYPKQQDVTETIQPTPVLQTTPPYTGFPTNYHIPTEEQFLENEESDAIFVAEAENSAVFGEEESFNHKVTQEAADVVLDTTPAPQTQPILLSGKSDYQPHEETMEAQEPVAVTLPQPTLFHQPLPPPIAAADELDDNDLIPFEWEEPSFEAEPAPVHIPKPASAPSVNGNGFSEPVSEPAMPVRKNRFAGVRNLLSQIEETLPETPPKPVAKLKSNGQSAKPAPVLPTEPTLKTRDKQVIEPAPAASTLIPENDEPEANVATTKRFNSVIPQVRGKAKVVTSLRKPARPVSKSTATHSKPDPTENNEQELPNADTEMEAYHDDWGQPTADVESQLPPDEQKAEPAANSDTASDNSTKMPEADIEKPAVQTILVLNDEKEPPPTYPTSGKKKQKRSTH